MIPPKKQIVLSNRRGHQNALMARMRSEQPGAFRGDWHGQDLFQFWSKRGWDYVSFEPNLSLTLSAVLDELPVAFVYAHEVKLTARNKAKRPVRALNMAYVVHSQFEGCGLATLLACYALREVAQHLPASTPFLIQARTANEASLAIGRRLGLREYSDCPPVDVSWKDDSGQSQLTTYATLMGSVGASARVANGLFAAVKARVEREIGMVNDRVLASSSKEPTQAESAEDLEESERLAP
jgi:hypothetical protein